MIQYEYCHDMAEEHRRNNKHIVDGEICRICGDWVTPLHVGTLKWNLGRFATNSIWEYLSHISNPNEFIGKNLKEFESALFINRVNSLGGLKYAVDRLNSFKLFEVSNLIYIMFCNAYKDYDLTPVKERNISKFCASYSITCVDFYMAVNNSENPLRILTNIIYAPYYNDRQIQLIDDVGKKEALSPFSFQDNLDKHIAIVNDIIDEYNKAIHKVFHVF